MKFNRPIYKYLFFTFLFLGVYIGTLPVLEGFQKEVKKEIEHKIKENFFSDDVLVHLDASNLHNAKWEKEGEEFIWEGYFYDIVKTYHKDGKLYYACFKDEKETQLVANITIVKSLFKIEPVKSNAAYKTAGSLVNAKYRTLDGITPSLFAYSVKKVRVKKTQFSSVQIELVMASLGTNYPPPEHLG